MKKVIINKYICIYTYNKGVFINIITTLSFLSSHLRVSRTFSNCFNMTWSHSSFNPLASSFPILMLMLMIPLIHRSHNSSISFLVAFITIPFKIASKTGNHSNPSITKIWCSNIPYLLLFLFILSEYRMFYLYEFSSFTPSSLSTFILPIINAELTVYPNGYFTKC